MNILDQMDDKAAEVDKLFSKWDNTSSPGCALAVMHNGRIICERGYGLSDLDHNVPVTPATVFHVASVSKQFTAASIVMLAQEGKLSLDDPARSYIPVLPDFGEPITIRQLIHHTSGLRDQWELLGLAGWRYSLDLITDDDVLALVSRQQELNFQPGSEFMYSNTGYTLLGLIVKRVSGQSLRQFTRARIFEPLGMKDTHFRDDHAEVVKDVAYGYVEHGDRFKLSITNFDTVGATSLLTTVRDLARWDANFYTGAVGGPALLSQMIERGKLNDGEELEYASGLMIGSYRGLPTVDHAGADAGYRADLIRFPEQKFSVACLCCLGNIEPGSLTRKVADIYLADQLEPVEPQESLKDLGSDFAGRAGLYVNRTIDNVLRVGFKGGKLNVMMPDDQSVELVPLTANRFRMGSFPVEFEFAGGEHDASTRVSVSSPLQKPQTLERVSEFEPNGHQLQEFAGTYYSDEVEARYHVTIDSGRLMLSSMKLKATHLRPATEDLFTGWFGRMRFTRDSHGHVSGMLFNSARIRHFRFNKIR